MKLLIVLLGAALTFPPQQKIEDMIKIACTVPPSPGVKMKLQGIGPFKDGTKLELLVAPLTEQLDNGRIAPTGGGILSARERFAIVKNHRFTFEHTGNGPGMYRVVICSEGIPKKRLAIISVVAWDDILLEKLKADLDQGEKLLLQAASLIERCEKASVNEATWKQSGKMVGTKLLEFHHLASAHNKNTSLKAGSELLSDVASNLHSDARVFRWKDGKLVPGDYYGDRPNYLHEGKEWGFEAFKTGAERAMKVFGHETALWILKDFTRRRDLDKLSSGGELALFYSHVKKFEKHPIVGRFMKRLLKLHVLKPGELERFERDLREP